ncbi:MAG: 2-iminoacetate synthase ThiH [Kiritimatiellae bacterium]|nr:2-iminoacetate synthase ThiH [Kiritimatiellia bacterium]
MPTFDQTLNDAAWQAAGEGLTRVSPEAVRRALAAPRPGAGDIPTLLAPAADAFLEQIAQRARETTLRRFGRTVALYAPIYLSNHCANVCLYCGFNCNNTILRKTLSAAEAESEMARVREQGFDHLLLVSGDHPREIPFDYIRDAVARAHRRFASVSVEVYPMDLAQYTQLAQAGCDGLVLYQETYHVEQYLRMHPRGWKRDYAGRLRAIEAGAEAGMRSVGLGALLGLSDWRREGLCLARHAAHLMKRFWRTRIAFSFPRICPAAGGFQPPCPVTDRDLVHMMCALRIAFPDAEIVISTRERAELRDRLVQLGVATRFSAGSRTQPGGYRDEAGATGQFDVHDRRTPAEVAAVIAAAGYDPVWKDWDRTFLGGSTGVPSPAGRPRPATGFPRSV